MDWTRDGFGALVNSISPHVLYKRVGLGAGIKISCRSLVFGLRVQFGSGFYYLFYIGSLSDDSVSPPNPTPTASSVVALATPDCHLSRHKCAHSGCSFA